MSSKFFLYKKIAAIDEQTTWVKHSQAVQLNCSAAENREAYTVLSSRGHVAPGSRNAPVHHPPAACVLLPPRSSSGGERPLSCAGTHESSAAWAPSPVPQSGSAGPAAEARGCARREEGGALRRSDRRWKGKVGNSMEVRLRLRLLLLALICLHAARWATAQQPEDATVIVKGSARIAETDENYLCATIDWWPPEKCNYNQCPWGQSSILNLDLDHPFLAQAIQAFDNLRIRLGGSLQDRVVYDVGTDSPCSPFRNMSNGLFGFSDGCLSMDRWDKLNDLFQKTGAIVTFGLNALYGRYNVRRSIWAGKWNSTNAYDFVKYTISKEYPVDSWEFGNELGGHGIGAKVDARLYGKDVVELKSILGLLYKAPLSQPLLLAPGGFFDQQWYTQLLQTSGRGVVSALTHHVYNLGGGDDVHLIRKILDPKYLDRAEDTYRDMQLTIQRHGTWASAWVSESGGVFNNGGLQVSNTFINSIWYLDQLGMASKYNTKVFCRQTLIGGHYGLLDTETFLPNPDYYSALLWHRLMGNGVLSVDINAPRRLRAYAHCRKQQQGITLLLINLSNTTGYNVTLQNDINVSLDKRPDHKKRKSFMQRLKSAVSWLGRKPSSDTKKREEYHLTTKDGDLQSKTMLLNGVPLELGDDGSVPALDPVLVAVDSPVYLAPTSIAFVALPKFEAKACS